MLRGAPSTRGSSRRPPSIVWGRVPTWAIRWLLATATIVILLHTFLVGTFQVRGTSMEKSLQQGDVLLVSKLGVTEAKFLGLVGQQPTNVAGRGEIVVFRFPRNPSLILVKRVIGLPGDRVVIRNGTVKIYNQQHPEGYDPAVVGYGEPLGAPDGSLDHVVPPDHVFVLGDNRTLGASIDSREWGDLLTWNIVGRAVIRLLPLRRAQLLTSKSAP